MGWSAGLVLATSRTMRKFAGMGEGWGGERQQHLQKQQKKLGWQKRYEAC
jgi:hypothetical protein